MVLKYNFHYHESAQDPPPLYLCHFYFFLMLNQLLWCGFGRWVHTDKDPALFDLWACDLSPKFFRPRTPAPSWLHTHSSHMHIQVQFHHYSSLPFLPAFIPTHYPIPTKEKHNSKQWVHTRSCWQMSFPNGTWAKYWRMSARIDRFRGKSLFLPLYWGPGSKKWAKIGVTKF